MKINYNFTNYLSYLFFYQIEYKHDNLTQQPCETWNSIYYFLLQILLSTLPENWQFYETSTFVNRKFGWKYLMQVQSYLKPQKYLQMKKNINWLALLCLLAIICLHVPCNNALRTSRLSNTNENTGTNHSQSDNFRKQHPMVFSLVRWNPFKSFNSIGQWHTLLCKTNL